MEGFLDRRTRRRERRAAAGADPADTFDSANQLALALLAGNDVEYRLSRQFRQPILSRLIVSAILTAVMATVIATPLRPLAYFVGSITGAMAVGCGVLYLWRGRFRTKVTARGIQIRGYFTHFVPWQEVRGIEVGGYGSPTMRLDDTLRPAVRMVRRPGYRSSGGSTSGKMARLATVKVVRTNGRKILLRAPLVTGWASDSHFTDKAKQLQQLCDTYAGPKELRTSRR